jgi:hypothetical protein
MVADKAVGVDRFVAALLAIPATTQRFRCVLGVRRSSGGHRYGGPDSVTRALWRHPFELAACTSPGGPGSGVRAREDGTSGFGVSQKLLPPTPDLISDRVSQPLTEL